MYTYGQVSSTALPLTPST